MIYISVIADGGEVIHTETTTDFPEAVMISRQLSIEYPSHTVAVDGDE